jgi:hypothetical protein
MSDSARKQRKMNGPQEDPAVTRFREYLRIKTVHPKPDYGTDISMQVTGFR